MLWNMQLKDRAITVVTWYRSLIELLELYYC